MQSWKPSQTRSAGEINACCFSTPEMRVDVIDLAGNEGLGEAGESDGLVMQVLSVGADLTRGDDTISCEDSHTSQA